MATLSALKKLKKFIERPIEVLSEEPTGIAKGIVESAKKDLANADTVREMWEQIYKGGHESDSESHEVQMEANKEYDVTGQGEKEAKRGHIEAGNEYHREIAHYAERAHYREVSEVEQRVQQILSELQRLVDSSSTILQAEYQEISVMQKPAEVGKYHINFFDWMLSVIQNARMKVEDSGAWLSTMQGKKGKKNYWAMFKKHGTSFGMSNERQVATQSG
jgi:hypothetical protein